MKLRICTDEEVAIYTESSAAYWAPEDERQRLVKACGEHEWELELDHPDDSGGVSLSCVKCPAATDDLFTDGAELLYLELDPPYGDVVVTAGKHNSPVPLVVPVAAEVEGWRLWTDYGWEYDAEIQIEQRGPARPPADNPPGDGRA